ncbi:hypothetical protein A2U01_0070807, partial [Trifolium medium]|nr:hypothetical protein [Trifolium medium]
MKVVDLCVSFPTNICASQWDTRSPSYDLCNESLSCRKSCTNWWLAPRHQEQSRTAKSTLFVAP